MLSYGWRKYRENLRKVCQKFEESLREIYGKNTESFKDKSYEKYFEG